MVSGDAILGGSTGYAALSSGSRTRPKASVEIMVQFFGAMRLGLGHLKCEIIHIEKNGKRVRFILLKWSVPKIGGGERGQHTACAVN
jgi:hypothetical protein